MSLLEQLARARSQPTRIVTCYFIALLARAWELGAGNSLGRLPRKFRGAKSTVYRLELG
jgi:hypothetical protein